MSTAIANSTTKRYTMRQPSLWDAPRGLPEQALSLDAFPLDCTLPFRWANGDTSASAAQRKLELVLAQRERYLYGGAFIQHCMVTYYVKVLEAWIEDGVVWGRCKLWPEGRLVDRLRNGEPAEIEEEEDGEPCN